MIGGLILLFVILVLGSLSIALTVFWIWMLVAAIQNKGLTESEKICWVLAIVFMHFIGSLLYLFIGHPKRHAPLLTSGATAVA